MVFLENFVDGMNDMLKVLLWLKKMIGDYYMKRLDI